MDLYETAALLAKQDDILILTHRRPDGDTIGCASALCWALRQLGKTAWLLPNKEAHGLFTPYLEGVLAPAAFTGRFVVSVDLATEGLFPDNAACFQGKVDLSIDHHGTNEFYARQTCVDPSCAACGELLYQLLVTMGVTVDQKIATLLYMAVSTDTGCFAYSNTTPQTHRITADLMEIGCNAQWVNKRHFRTKSIRRLRLESMITRDMELFDDGTIAIASVTLAMMAELHATEEDAEDIAAFVGQVEGVRYAVTLRELKPGECKMSLRTDASLNAATVCALLGGGGHPAASGCTVAATVEQSKSAMLSAIRKVLYGDERNSSD